MPHSIAKGKTKTSFAIAKEVLSGVNEGGRTLDLQGHNLAL